MISLWKINPITARQMVAMSLQFYFPLAVQSERRSIKVCCPLGTSQVPTTFRDLLELTLVCASMYALIEFKDVWLQLKHK